MKHIDSNYSLRLVNIFYFPQTPQVKLGPPKVNEKSFKTAEVELFTDQMPFLLLNQHQSTDYIICYAIKLIFSLQSE